MAPTTLNIATEYLSVLFSGTGTMTLYDRKRKVTWLPDPWFDSPGELVLWGPRGQAFVDLKESGEMDIERQGDGVRLTYTKFVSGGKAVPGKLTVFVAPVAGEAALRVTVEKLRLGKDWRLSEITFPVRFGWLRSRKETGWLAVPLTQGYVIPSHDATLPAGHFMKYDDVHHDHTGSLKLRAFQWGGLSMPWHGICQDRGGLLSIIETPYDAAAWVLMNNGHAPNRPHVFEGEERILNASTAWDSVDGELAYPRTVRIDLTSGSYTALAKRYRAWREEQGGYVTLKEKAKELPQVERLRGCSSFSLYGNYPHYEKYDSMWFHFDDLMAYLKALKAAKIDKCLVLAWGLFGVQPPVEWPIDARRGGKKKLQECFKLADELGYVMTGYHSPAPSLKDAKGYFPEFRREMPGQKMERWVVNCSVCWDQFTFAHMDEEQKLLKPLIHYLDIVSTNVLECKHPEHPRTRREYAAALVDLYRRIHERGRLNMTERGYDFLIPHLDVFDGMLYTHSVEPFYRGAFPVPLFNLCHHDAAVCTWHPLWDYHQPTTTAGTTEKVLLDLIGGNPARLVTTKNDFPGQLKRMAAYHQLLGKWHAQVGFEELVEHHFPAADHRVQVSRFGDGSEVWVNLGYGDAETTDGRVVPGRGYVMKTEKREKKASISF